MTDSGSNTDNTQTEGGRSATSCSAIEFSQDDFSTVRFEKESDSDTINIHDPHNAWKDWYSLTETQAHDLKCWLERNFQQNSQAIPSEGSGSAPSSNTNDQSAP